MDPIGSTTWEVNWREVEAEGERKVWEMLREKARGEVDHLEVMEVNSTGRNENTAEMGRYYEGVARTEEEYWRQVEVDGERGMWEMVRGGQMEEEENVQQRVELDEADSDDVIVLDDSDNEINNNPGDLGTDDESQCDINDLATVSRGSSRSFLLF